MWVSFFFVSSFSSTVAAELAPGDVEGASISEAASPGLSIQLV